MTDHIPPASGTPDPASESDHIPSPWAGPPAETSAPTYAVPAGTSDAAYAAPTYAGQVSDLTVTGADLSATAIDQPNAGGESFVAFGVDRPAPRRGRRRAIVLSASTALLLLVGAGAYAGVRAWTGAGADEPESAMPASVSAFARVDLDPGYGDKLTVNGLVKKFPTQGKSTTDLITKLETSIAKDAGLDYTTDVKPWFAGRAGIGAWSDAEGKPVALIAIASKDDAKAAATLTKLRQSKGSDSFGFAMEKGYALIAGSNGDMQAAATAAAAAAKTATLADNATFKSTVAHVGGGNLLLAYADLGKVSALAKSASSSILNDSGGGFSPGGGFAFGPGSGPLAGNPLGMLGLPGLAAGGTSGLTGFVAVGGKVTGDGIEVRAHFGGSKPASAGTKVMSTLAAEPSATIVGVSTAGLDPSSGAAKQLSSVLGALASGAAFGAGASTDDPFAGDPGTDPLGSDPGTDPGTDPLAGTLNTAIAGVVTPILTARQLSVAFTGLSSDRTPGVLINIQERDAATASSLADSVNRLIGGQAPAGLLKVTQSGASVNATIGTPVLGGSVGASDLFKTTMSGMSDATAAGYFDVQKVIAATRGTMSAADRNAWAPVKAIGFGATSGQSTMDVLLRIVIK